MLGPIIASIAIGSALDAYASNRAMKDRADALRIAGDRALKAYEAAAADTFQAGTTDVMTARLKGAEVIGDATTVMGASRLEGGEDVLRKTAFMTELDAQMIKKNARASAWGLQLQGMNIKNQMYSEAASVDSERKWIPVKTIIGMGSKGASLYAKYGGGEPETDPASLGLKDPYS